MTSLSARRLIPACILSAATVAALAAPGATRAAIVAAERMHAGMRRRAERDVIVRLPPD